LPLLLLLGGAAAGCSGGSFALCWLGCCLGARANLPAESSSQKQIVPLGDAFRNYSIPVA